MQNAYCSLIPVGTAEELKLYKMLENERKRNGGGRIILNTQLATFINPDWENEDRYKKACLYGRITLASVRKNKSAALLIAILPEKDHYAAESRELLERYGVRVISGNLPQEIEAVQVELAQALRTGLSPTMLTKRVINDGENLLARLAKAGLDFFDDLVGFEKDPFCIHHEIALDAVINVAPSAESASASDAAQHTYEELADYAKMARFDVLITTSLPQGTPVLALEYDGQVFHKTQRGKRRDAKKAELCRLSQLPLMRLRCVDLPTRRDPTDVGSTQNSSADDKSDLFRMLVTYMTRVISFRRKQEIERERDFVDYWDRIEWQAEYGDSPERDEANQLSAEAYFRKEFAERNRVLSPVSYDLNKDGLSVNATIADAVSGATIMTIASPRFNISMIGRELHSVDRLMKSFALTWLYQKIVSAGV
jgi:hypothetical protein